MPKRIKDYASAATTIASDDYFAIDGATNGTRKTLLTAFGTTGLLFGAGTAAAPKLAVGTASNGIYAPSGNTLGFSTNGAQQWRIDSFGTLVSDVQSTPVVRFQPALPGTTCGVEWFDTGAVLAAYTKYNVTSPQLEINAGKSGSTGRIVFYTNTTDVGRFTSSQCFLVGTTSETGLTGAAGMKVASTTLATSGSTGAFIVAGSAGFGKKCFITDGSTGAQLRLEYTAASVYTDLATLSTGHFLVTTTGGNRITSTTVNDTSVLARQVQGGLAFDGVTAGGFVSYPTTFVSSVRTANSFSYSTTFTASDLNDNRTLIYVSEVSQAAFRIALKSSYLCAAYYNLASPAYVVNKQITTSIIEVGKLYHLTVTWDGASFTAYLNGIAQTQSGTPSLSISATTAANLGYYSSSSDQWNGTIFSATLFNRALSASEVITLANQGVQEADKWGGFTDYISNTVNNGGFETASGGVVAPWVTSQPTVWIASTAGTTTFERDTAVFHTGTASLKITCNDNIFAQVYVPNLGNRYGKRMRLSFWAKADASTSNFLLNLINATTVATPALTTSWTLYSYDFVSDYNSSASGIRISTTGSPSGRTAWFDDITLTPIGAILDADLSAGVGYQVPDRSSNKYHGVVSATGTSWTLAQRRGQVRATTNTLGNQQIFSQVSLPTNAIITSIVGYTTGTPTVYVGNVSGGSQLVASVAMSASTYTSFTLAAITSTTGNVWVNSSTSDTINWTITYMIADP